MLVAAEDGNLHGGPRILGMESAATHAFFDRRDRRDRSPKYRCAEELLPDNLYMELAFGLGQAHLEQCHRRFPAPWYPIGSHCHPASLRLGFHSRLLALTKLGLCRIRC